MSQDEGPAVSHRPLVPLVSRSSRSPTSLGRIAFSSSTCAFRLIKLGLLLLVRPALFSDGLLREGTTDAG